MDANTKAFHWTGEEDGELIDMAFSKKKVEDRKRWLRAFKPGTFLDHSVRRVRYEDFINKELILFSVADLQRSIPNVMDGLKPSQRKVLFACFKRRLRTDIKVAQLSGYVSEHSAYHHGEASLGATIVGLAQDFVGTNNVNLLVPSGQFGTRLQGGKDHASPRYIFTRLAPLARAIFPEADDALLSYLSDDGQRIEPEYYLPILPLLLVNGADGIGTGWSTSVPNYNPRDIVANLKRMLDGEAPEKMHPWYRGFKGTITEVRACCPAPRLGVSQPSRVLTAHPACSRPLSLPRCLRLAASARMWSAARCVSLTTRRWR
jgi:DNA topoisomerase-2